MIFGLDPVVYFRVYNYFMKSIDQYRKSVTIGQVAKLTGVGIETIRFYEKERLVNRPGRSISGYRQYSPQDVATVRFIVRAKKLGFEGRRRKRYEAFALSIIASGMMILGKFVLETPWLLYSGATLLVSASMMNLYLRRGRNANCHCAESLT